MAGPGKKIADKVAKDAGTQLSPEDTTALKTYLQNSRGGQQPLLGKPEDDPVLFPKYEDTGRTKTSIFELPGSLAFGPARAGVHALQQGKTFAEAVREAKARMGKDPSAGPGYGDIALEAGAGPAVATAAQLAGDVLEPAGIPGLKPGMAMGVAGTVKAQKGTSKAAKEILERIDTPEKAAVLQGKEKTKYLKALDEVYGPREQRAKDMGFGSKKTFYHGTTEEGIRQFNPKMGTFKTVGPGDIEGASYFSSNPEVAGSYGETIYPVKLSRKSGVSIEPDWNTVNPEVVQQMREAAQKPGVTSVTVPNVYDAIGIDKPYSDIVAVTDPTKVRSTFAAFDPRFKDSPLLLAGRTGAGSEKAERVRRVLDSKKKKKKDQ